MARTSAFVAGVDEAGRGPLAGPVVAAVVVLGSSDIQGLADSKTLSRSERQRLFAEIQAESLAFSLGSASPIEIDCLNIHKATLLAMKRAITRVLVPIEIVLVDGKFTPQMGLNMRAVVKGDTYIKEISAASILAKESRDITMEKYDVLYPGYGFRQHKGYPTKFHLEALHKLGPTPIHRISFKPVNDVLSIGKNVRQ